MPDDDRAAREHVRGRVLQRQRLDDTGHRQRITFVADPRDEAAQHTEGDRQRQRERRPRAGAAVAGHGAAVGRGDLADDRPSATQLTEFYFWIACGGMLGGLFNALIAPVLFVEIVEYPIMVVAACLLRSVPRAESAKRLSVGDVAVPLAVGGAVAVSALVNNHFGSLSRYLLLGAAVPALVVLSQKQHRVRFAGSVAMILLAQIPDEDVQRNVVLRDVEGIPGVGRTAGADSE